MKKIESFFYLSVLATVIDNVPLQDESIIVRYSINFLLLGL